MSLLRRSQDCIAQGALTNSKRPESFIKGVYPTHIVKAKECYLWDNNGEKYVDYICGLGTNLLGYGNEQLASDLQPYLTKGFSPSLPTADEVITAEQVKSKFPLIDKLKFLKTGSDACTAAVRIARAATGRRWVLTEGYHGTHDEFVSLMPPHYGIPEKSSFMQNISEGVDWQEYFPPDDVAAIIVEPVEIIHDPIRIAYLKSLREQCDRHGIILIFDEVITGYRYLSGSVAYAHGIHPDLICLGKAMANGLPLSAVGGKREVMEAEEYFYSSTYAGETLSLAAARSVLKLLKRPEFNVKDLWDQGELFLERFNQMDSDIKIIGYPTRGRFQGNPNKINLFYQETCKAGILFGPSWFYNFPLMAEDNNTLEICEQIIRNINLGIVKLEGDPPQSPFAQKVRER